MNGFKSKFKNAEMSPGFLLWKISNLHQRTQKKALEGLKLTPSQFSVLATYLFLSIKNDPLTQTDVCHHAGIDKMLVSDLTNTLAKKLYIVKSKNEYDGRYYDIKVTKLGAETCNKALKIIEEIDRKFFAKTRRSKELLEIMQELAKD